MFIQYPLEKDPVPTPENSEVNVLKKIADAKKDDKNNTRWVIITELAYEYCVELKNGGRPSWEVAAENRKYTRELEEIFLKLARENKIELDFKTGVVALKEPKTDQV